MLFAVLEVFLHQCLNVMQVNNRLFLVELKEHLVSYENSSSNWSNGESTYLQYSHLLYT